MENIVEVARYFLSEESMTHKKLQKLCYYAQAWHLANYQEPLFKSVFEAWVHGPVSPDLYQVYNKWGWLPITQSKDVIPQFSNQNKTRPFLSRVYNTYKGYSADQLEAITHQEGPWKNARKGYSAGEYCRNIIQQKEMMHYYGERLKG